MAQAYINAIATGVPPRDVHQTFLQFATNLLEDLPRERALFARMAERAGIERRFSYLSLADAEGSSGFYQPGRFPSTALRMAEFARHAPELARDTIEKLGLGRDLKRITHLVISCCTGFFAPGLDFAVVQNCRLPASVERSLIGFMGCCAAINTLKLARHIVRSEPDARVLVLNLELCSLHLKETTNLEELLSFLVFADGCAASLVTAEPVGIALDSFRAVIVPDTQGLITWNIGDCGFDMFLSGQVPGAIQQALRGCAGEILQNASPADIALWAVHPGGKSVLDAVERAFDLKEDALQSSRETLRDYGNMSSPTVMFVLQKLLARGMPGERGCAMAFGPGLVAETMLFHKV